MALPRVQLDILFPVIKELEDQDRKFVAWMWEHLCDKQPVIADYLRTIKNNDVAILVGLVIYRLLESQDEVNNLNNLFK